MLLYVKGEYIHPVT